MTYNFDKSISREGTNCVKYDRREELFGNNEVIPMWVADMDFKTPPFIIDALKKRLTHELMGYSIRRDEYFTSFISWVSRRLSWKIEKEWIAFSPGVVPAVNMCTLAYTNEGDKVIVQPPVYYPFFPAVKDHNRVLVYNPLHEENGRWYVDIDDLSSRAREGAAMIILSNPHNPVGRAWRRDELEQIASVCLENNIIILSDEIHSDLVLPGNHHVPMASISPEVADITVTCMAPSKTFNLAGLSTSSVIISNEKLRERFTRVTDSLHIGMGNIFGTEASVAAYSYGDEWLDQLLGYIAKNVEYLIDYCNAKIPAIKPVIPEATYLVWLDCRELGMDSTALSNFFIKKAGLGLNEGSTFGPGGEGFMRINLACPLATVKEAMERLYRAYKELKV